MAAKSITMKQRFNVPLDQVFPVFNQHATFNTILWPIQSIVIKQSHDPDNADGVGSVRKMGVGPLKFIQEEITKIIPNQMIEYQMLKNPLFSYHLGRLEFIEKAGQTELTYTIWLDSPIPLMAKIGLLQLKASAKLGLKKVASQVEKGEFNVSR
ncbi:SRPBCC family protein [Acinetobacter ursingii]|uniref:SRPBCC family protein n=2 Tax=Acinetobacter ursingii TaxID=108980 RepID=UPI00124DFF6D|nr:SRPBCC family protein [Acinetobacter ursingii]MCU4351918.1 SRPBCC family protein [Acinetobacter ursingii]MDI3239636.1 SRPBCC family protein [Acinetobacter ursingii]